VARYAQGQPVRVSTEVRDATGALTTPGTILLRVKKPDGTFLADYSSPTLDSTGKYHVDVPASDVTTLGHYAYAWITSGTAAGVSPPAAFEVVDPFTPSHITFADARQRLNTSATSDDEIQAFIAAAVSAQERRVGAIAPRTVTEVVTGWPQGYHSWHPGYLMLGQTRPAEQLPVLSVTSATLNGVTVDTSQWFVENGLAGKIRPSVSWPFGSSAPGFTYGVFAVTYVAGRSPVPQDLVEAGLLRVMHYAATQRGGGGGAQIIGAASTDEPVGVDSTDFLLILRAEDLEKPYLMSGIA